MNIKIDRNSKTPVYLQIKNGIRNLITTEELFPGFKLPSERKLAEELNVHRNTVIKAYAELVAEGYVTVSRVAPKGYFVVDTEKDKSFTGRFFPLGKRLRYNFTQNERLFFNLYDLGMEENNYISMGGINVSFLNENEEEFCQIMSHICCNTSNDEVLRLKKNICSMLEKENIYVNEKNIQISTETNQILNQICDLFLSEGDIVVAEEPIIADNIALFRNKGIELVTIPMEEDGMNMRILENVVAKKRPKFIYTLPTYHNPTGITMSLEKRFELLKIANKYDIPIIEETSQDVFNYSGRRLPSLYAIDKNESVICIDSFTLSFPYDIKIAYVIGPYDFIDMFGRYVVITETTIGSLTHRIFNEFIELGYYDEHIERLVPEIRKRRDIMYRELQKIKDKGIRCTLPEGGLSIWCEIDDIKESDLVEEAKRRGLIIMPGFVFYPYGNQGTGHIRLAYSNCTSEEIVRGIGILAESIDVCKNKTGEEE